MTAGIDTMQASLAQSLESLHTRIATTILALDPAALGWQATPGLQTLAEQIAYAANEERRWILEGLAGMPPAGGAEPSTPPDPAGHALFELGSVGQASQMILGQLTPGDWLRPRQVAGQTVTGAGCILAVLIELARLLGHIEATAQLWKDHGPD